MYCGSALKQTQSTKLITMEECRRYRSMIPAAKPNIGRKERKAVRRVLKSGMLAQGPEVAAFEKEFSKLVNSEHCIAVNSGTSALHLALLAAEIQSGDEVIVPLLVLLRLQTSLR